ncbi:hypothetical protein BDW66DRAFT_151228 [Aspergillus desertorum]
MKSALALSLKVNGIIDAASLKRPDARTEEWRGQVPVPSSYEAPRFRYWWPGGWIDPDVVKEEVEAISLAGFGGAEMGDVRDSITVAMDPKVYGWAQDRWNAGFLQHMRPHMTKLDRPVKLFISVKDSPSVNLWTGEVLPIASFHIANGYTAVNVTIGENGVEAVYLGRQNPYNVTNLSQHIVATDGEGVADKSGNVLLRATGNGKYTAELSTGKATTVTFSSVPAAVTPNQWLLMVEDWSPATANETGHASSNTKKTTLPPITLSKLAFWHNISGLDIRDRRMTRKHWGSISLRRGGGSWDLRINDRVVPGVDFFTSKPLDVTPYIRDGENDIKITVATTLWNKLRKTWPDLYGTLDPEAIGLLGTVRFTYYAQQQVL